MIELIADNTNFFVSMITLKKYPDFVVTKMIDTNNKTDLGGLVECVAHNRYVFDTTPDVLADIVKNLRSSDDTSYGSSILNRAFNVSNKSITSDRAQIFSKPEETTNNFDNEHLLNFFRTYGIDNQSTLVSSSDVSSRPIQESSTLNRRSAHNTFRAKKIEIDTLN
jgi:hypothetical protein